MNIKQVAKRAKVSTATVSRTINGSDKVSPETAERVRKVIHDMNFFPNSHARTLVSGRSRMVGLIISDITNPFFPELVKNFEDQAVDRGLEIIIGNTDYKPKRMVSCIRRMLERKVDGVAIMTSETDMALLDAGKTGDHSASVKIEYAQGIREAAEHLFSLNHQRVAFIAGPQELESARIRREAFVAAMKARGYPVEAGMIQEGNHRIDGGSIAMRNLLMLENPPTAVMTSNDMTAIGALGTIHEAGMRVPQDISVVGFDGISFSNLTQPPLTTVLISRTQLALTAFAALERLIKREDVQKSDYVIPAHLILRGSTRAI
jgi:DNA-binding LacI/PurR family transcriptional regulator